MSNTLLLSSSHIVRIRYLLPSNSSQPASLIVTPNKSKPVMTTITKNISSNSYGYLSPQTSSSSSSSEKTCNICKRLLYSFEEILICRICYGSYHWRCVRPETISFYGNNDNYICDKCNDSTTNTNSSHRLINSRNRTKSPESLDTNHRDFLSIPSRTSSTDANVGNTIQHFQEKQQLSPTHRTTKASELDDYLPSETNENEYQQQNGQYDNDSRTTRQIQQQQQNGIESDDENENENDRTTMFQANYQYTPLKEYAAMRGSRTTNDNNSNDYQNSTPDYSDRPPTSRYGGGLHYTNHGYDPTLSRVIGAPSLAATNFTSPTIDNLSIHNRQHHFVSTTNLNLKEKPSRHQQQQQQQNSLAPSSPYLSPNRDSNSPVFKSSSHHQQEQSDRRSTIGSDSGIVIVNPSSQQQQQQQQPQHFDENHIVEKKLTNLVQQLGKQLENDAQKLNEKLEIKLKELENMINQQTYIIRRQDEVIENLKSKISEIETERDHFRNRLSIHEQREQDEKKKLTTNETEKFYQQDYIHEQDNQSDTKYSNASTVTTDYSKPSTKKTPAPRVVEQRWSITSDEHEPTVAKIVKNVPINRERLESDTSSPPAVIGKLVSSTHLKETPAASSRLDNIIHQKNTKDIVNPSSSTYSLAQVRHQDRPQILEPISMEQQIITSVHHDDSDSDGDDDSNKKKNVIKQKRSNSSSSSSTTSPTLSAPPVKTVNSTTTTTNRNSQKYPSFESLQPTYQNEQGSKLTTKTASLQFGIKPVQDEPGSIYMTPVTASHPAIQSNSPVKGWLRKQNRDSFFKRKERYYCILTDNALLLHRHDHDTTPHKAINLRGAKVLYYDDPKYGPSLELTWTKPPNDEKHYHLYAPNPHEAERWVTGIQTTIHNLDNKNKWQRYRMNT